MYIIIVGVGRIGIRALEFATKENNDVVVIEKDKDKINRANMEYDCVFIQGDATFKSSLRDADAKKADALISTTGDDADNLLIMKNAKDLGIPRLTSVVNHDSRINLFKELDVNIVGDPYNMIGKYLFRSTKRISTKNYMTKDMSINNYMRLSKGAEVFEINISDKSPLEGKTLEKVFNEEIDRENNIILTIDRDGNLLIPQADTKFKKGDLITVLTKKEPRSNIVKKFIGR